VYHGKMMEFSSPIYSLSNCTLGRCMPEMADYRKPPYYHKGKRGNTICLSFYHLISVIKWSSVVITVAVGKNRWRHCLVTLADIELTFPWFWFRGVGLMVREAFGRIPVNWLLFPGRFHNRLLLALLIEFINWLQQQLK
jgi:hypothetical protein